jgi:hypothetical protein
MKRNIEEEYADLHMNRFIKLMGTDLLIATMDFGRKFGAPLYLLELENTVILWK